ncbi:MAG: glutaredoxin family protein [Nitrosomonadales bacterium]|nr:glutaredoxin family protein [Nitrosomonadales bacterium]
MKLLLYGTSFCHLCEDAEAILQAIGVTAEYLDIAEDDALMEPYGVRIPVLRRMDNGAELGWPFDAAAVQRFLA